MYSAYDGQHEFKIPAVVTGVKKVKWSLSDPEVADIETQSDGSAMITVRKAGYREHHREGGVDPR